MSIATTLTARPDLAARPAGRGQYGRSRRHGRTPMAATTALDRVPGVPETLLSRVLLAGLPQEAAPAPWGCVCDAVVWLGRGGAAATAALPPALRVRGRGLGV